MRMKKFVVGLLVLGLAVSVLGMIGFAKNPSAKVDDKVTWTIEKFIELTIDHSAFDFGTIDAGMDEVFADNANTLFITSNTAWELTFSVKGQGSDYLVVDLSKNEGSGTDTVDVDYTLINILSMKPGSYKATVTYTVTAK